MNSKFPINRIVAFVGPYIAVVSGALADWLVVHVHLLSLFHTTSTAISGMLTQGLVFGLTALLVWLGQQKWLSGWQKWESTIVSEAANYTYNGPFVESPPMGTYDPEADYSDPSVPEQPLP